MKKQCCKCCNNVGTSTRRMSVLTGQRLRETCCKKTKCFLIITNLYCHYPRKEFVFVNAGPIISILFQELFSVRKLYLQGMESTMNISQSQTLMLFKKPISIYDLPLLLEDIPLEMRRSVLFLHESVPTNYGRDFIHSMKRSWWSHRLATAIPGFQ